jgi:glycosyltransferase involved in cell wall biosynthesis
MARHALLVTYSLELGGTQRATVFVAGALAEAGWRVSVVTCADRPRHFALPAGVAESPGWTVTAGVAALGRPGRWAAQALRLRRLLRADRPEAVIAFGHHPSLLAVAASAGTGVPVIASDRVAPSQDPLERGPWPAAVRLLYPRAARLVCVSAGIAAERPWLPAGKVVTIPNAVQLDAAPVPGDPALTSADAPHVIALGRLHPQKGFDLLIGAFARLAADHPAWHLTIIGEGPERARLEAEVARFGLTGRVHLPGAAKAPAVLLRAAAAGSVFAFPSRFEGFPNVLIEAMACGLPVVAADCRYGPGEILEGGRGGLLVPVEDAAALAAALDRVMGDRALRDDLAGRARARAADYAPERIAPQWLALLDEVAGER